jgi:signal transduction histidine kinase/CHASE2 domain-containing sensor protein
MNSTLQSAQPQSIHRQVRSWGRWLRRNLLLLAIVGLVSMSFPVVKLGQSLTDFFFRLRGPQPVSQQVALVLIDDTTLAHYGRWPWQRQQLAQLIRAVSAQHPKAIGLDVLLPEVEDETDDAALESAIASAPNLVLAAKISGSLDNSLWIDPLPRFSKNAKGVGHVQAIVDGDGLCRSIPLEEPSTEGPRPAFALKVAELINPALANMESISGVNAPAIQKFVTRPVLIDFRHQYESREQPQPFSVISAGELLAGMARPELRDKAVLIGFGGIEMSDRLATPVSNQLPMPGVEINANAVDMFLAGRSIRYVSFTWQWLLVAFTGAFALWLVSRYPGIPGLLLLSLTLAAGYAGCYLLFAHAHQLLVYTPILLAGFLAAPLAQLENLLLVDREVTFRLQQLRQTIRPARTPAQDDGRPRDSRRLHWKLAALNDLQDELSSLYRFHQTLLESMREGLAVYGQDGILRFGNPTWAKFCANQSADPRQLSSLSQMTSAWPEFAAVAQAGGTWIETELPLGDELWHLYAVPLPWTSFAQEGAVMIIAEDITVRRQRDQARSEALSFVTHELRTPLIAIQGFSEMLMRYPNSPASADAPATIFRETHRLVAMINTYLEVLRLDAGARPLRLTHASVRGMADHVEKVVRPLALAARIAVEVEIDPEDEHVTCDETLISGALLNLVSNAIKYGEKDSEVLMRITAHKDEVEFEVHNTGKPIPPAELKHIFERFYRPARSESIPGWGLGLSFVRRICQQHGGRIAVSSDQEMGTSFCFMLPRGVREVTEVTP